MSLGRSVNLAVNIHLNPPPRQLGPSSQNSGRYSGSGSRLVLIYSGVFYRSDVRLIFKRPVGRSHNFATIRRRGDRDSPVVWAYASSK